MDLRKPTASAWELLTMRDFTPHHRRHIELSQCGDYRSWSDLVCFGTRNKREKKVKNHVNFLEDGRGGYLPYSQPNVVCYSDLQSVVAIQKARSAMNTALMWCKSYNVVWPTTVGMAHYLIHGNKQFFWRVQNQDV